MAQKSQITEQQYSIDFFKLECYCKHKNISLSALSLSVGKSRNWLSELKRASEHSKTKYVSINILALLAYELNCTIQDIRYYPHNLFNENANPLTSEEYEQAINKLSKAFMNSSESLPPQFEGHPEVFMRMVYAYVEKEYKFPIVVNYSEWAKSLVNRLGAQDTVVLTIFLLRMLKMDADELRTLRLLLLKISGNSSFLHKNSSSNVPGQHWWISLLLSELREEILSATFPVSIPSESDLRRIYKEHSMQRSDEHIPNNSSEDKINALSKSLKTSIIKIIGSVLEDDTDIQNISTRCAQVLHTYFTRLSPELEIEINAYKAGNI